MTKILGVVGSMRSRSHTRRLMTIMLEEARAAGAETRLLDLGETQLPLFNPEQREAEDARHAAAEAVSWADAFVLGSPDYHGSMSGPLKNLLDHFWGEFTGKLFAYIVASHEKGLTVQDQMRTVVRQCYGWSMPYGIGFNGDAAFDQDGNLHDETLARRVRMMAWDLTIYGGLLQGQFRADLAREPRHPGFAEAIKG